MLIKWDEEIKCLFLRVRSPSQQTFDSFIRAIFGNLLSQNAISYLSKTKLRFGDFRHKFNENILQLISSYKDKKEL
jgi:hypothetical protein